MKPHTESTDGILSALKVEATKGLNTEEVQKRLVEHGENRLKEKKKKSNLVRFLEQFKDAMIIILLVAAAVSFVIAINNTTITIVYKPYRTQVTVLLQGKLIFGWFNANTTKAMAITAITKPIILEICFFIHSPTYLTSSIISINS